MPKIPPNKGARAKISFSKHGSFQAILYFMAKFGKLHKICPHTLGMIQTSSFCIKLCHKPCSFICTSKQTCSILEKCCFLPNFKWVQQQNQCMYMKIEDSKLNTYSTSNMGKKITLICLKHTWFPFSFFRHVSFCLSCS